MPRYYEITYLPGGRVEEFGGSRGNYYELADGTRLDLHPGPAWCRQCGGLSHGEEVEPLDEIDRRLAEMADPASDVYRWMMECTTAAQDGRGEQFRQRQVEKLRVRRRWREGRVSPPRCLVCGTTDIVALEPDRPVPHPAGRGRIVARVVGMCSTAWNDWFFTPEGERVWHATPELLRADGWVSVWLGTYRSAAELGGYLSGPYGFETDFGFRIDPADPPRSTVVEDGPPEPVGELLGRLRGSAGFAGVVAATVADRLNWNRATAAVVFDGLRYDPRHDRTDPGDPLRFVGAFECGRPG